MAIKVEINEKGLVQSKTDVSGPATFHVNGFVPGGVMPVREIEGALTITSIEYYSQQLDYFTMNYQIDTSDIGKCVKLKVTDLPPEYGEYGEYPGFRGGPQLILPDCPVGSSIRIVCGTGIQGLDSELGLQEINTTSELSYLLRNSSRQVNIVAGSSELSVGTIIDLFKVGKFSAPIETSDIGYDEYGEYDGEGPYDQYGVDSRIILEYNFWRVLNLSDGGW